MTITAAESSARRRGGQQRPTRDQLLNQPRSGARPLGGSPGPAGGPGAAGRTGPAGPAGSAGRAGATGAPGTGAAGRAGAAGQRGKQGPAGRPGRPGRRPARAGAGQGKGKGKGKGKQRRYVPAARRLTGASTSPGTALHNYQGIIAAEFVAAELLVATTPIAAGSNKPGLSPYEPADMVKLLALGLVYLILEVIAAAGGGTARVTAWVGALILLAVGLGEASRIADIIDVLSGGRPHNVTLTGTQAPATKDASPIPPLGQGQPSTKPKSAPLGG